MAFGQANFALARPMPRFRPFAALVFSLLAAGTARAADRFDIAITVDDLPAHGLLPPGMTRLGIAQTYIAALKAHHVPQAWGFVNGGKIAQDPDGAAVLAAWRKAGYPLGNHTWSHMNAGRASSLAAWEADADRNEPVLRTYMAGENWRMLRFPNLSVGADEARRDGVFAWMKANGYREADVSAAFSDWDYSDAYARCLAKGDQAAGSDEGVLNGVTVTDITPQLRAQLQLPDDLKGAVITDVESDSASARDGLRQGDVVLGLDRKPVSNADEAVKLSEAIKGPKVLVRVWRDGGSRYVVVDESDGDSGSNN